MFKQAVINGYRAKVEKEIKIFFKKKVQESKRVDKDLGILTEELSRFVLRGGKRIRALLFILSFKSFNKKLSRDAYKFGAALEIAHGAALIHDDFIDQDDLRRGKPTIHRYFTKAFRKKLPAVKAERMGDNLAILGGDMIAAFATELALAAKFPASAKIRALEYFFWRSFDMGLGEMLDIHFSGRDNISKNRIMDINYLKTTTYTTEGPLVIGGILAGVPARKMSDLKKFGRLLGESFQIKDDLLGIFGDKKKLGKPLGSDLREGKMNYVVKQTLLNVAPDEKKKIMTFFRGKKKGKTINMKDFRSIIESSGSLKDTNDYINKRIFAAKKVLAASDLNEASKKSFNQIADYIVNRKS